MTVNGISGANNGMQAGSSGRITQMDSVSKNIQNQIANAQKKLQELSSNEELSIEDKMKKRQEIQQEINNLNQQLRQHQMEQRKEQQTKKTSMDDMLGGSRKTAPKSECRSVTGKHAGDDFRRFLYETSKGTGEYGNTNGRQSRCVGI